MSCDPAQAREDGRPGLTVRSDEVIGDARRGTRSLVAGSCFFRDRRDIHEKDALIFGCKFPAHALVEHHAVLAGLQRTKFEEPPTGIHGVPIGGSQVLIIHEDQGRRIIGRHPQLTAGPILPERNIKRVVLRDGDRFLPGHRIVHRASTPPPDVRSIVVSCRRRRDRSGRGPHSYPRSIRLRPSQSHFSHQRRDRATDR